MGGVYLRGVINNVARKQQINDFKDLRFGSITPTDLDGVIEYRDKAYVFYEIKYLDAELPHGQRLCLERLVHDTLKAGKRAIALIVEHSVHSTEEHIPVAQCHVREFFFKPRDGWMHTKRYYNALELTQKFFAYADSDFQYVPMRRKSEDNRTLIGNTCTEI